MGRIFWKFCTTWTICDANCYMQYDAIFFRKKKVQEYSDSAIEYLFPYKKDTLLGTLGIYCIVWCTTLKTRFLNVFNLSCETLLQPHVPWKVQLFQLFTNQVQEWANDLYDQMFLGRWGYFNCSLIGYKNGLMTYMRRGTVFNLIVRIITHFNLYF